MNLGFVVSFAMNIHISRDFSFKKIFCGIGNFTAYRVVLPANFFADSIAFYHFIGEIVRVSAFDVVRKLYLQFFRLFNKKDDIKRVVLRISYPKIPLIDIFSVG